MEISGYQILKPIGAGGMATAYLAVQTSLGRQVVLKVLDTSKDVTPENVERFMNEGRIIASLNHPNIVTIYDVGQAENLVYISMEYVEGGDLKGRMGRIASPVEAIDIVRKIAGALDCAHKNGVIHRDVKPANILFRRDGTPLLSDFGIAKKLTVDRDLTNTGIFLGSPNYMAPEQAEGVAIDGRADIYSLGIIFYEMLTGKKPFHADSVIDIIVQHRQAPIPILPAGLDGYQPLLNLMIAKQRRDRFHDAESLLHYLRDMERRGVIKSGVELTRAPDIDVSGGHSMQMTLGEVEMRVLRPPSRRISKTLVAVLMLVSAGFTGLHYYAGVLKTQMSRPPDTPPGSLAVQPEPAPPPAAAAPPPVAAPSSDDVTRALAWLAQKSLDDFRLTSPPQDNAYYYYSRLREIDPASSTATDGFKRIAERFALLAEREIAEGRDGQAQSYITIGLQIDPGNAVLAQLRELAQTRKHSFMEALGSLFRK